MNGKRQICSTTIEADGGQHCSLKYYLTTNVLRQRRQKISYGVCVTKHDENGNFLDMSEVGNISFDCGVCLKILNILKDGAVTPLALVDVIEDMEEFANDLFL